VQLAPFARDEATGGLSYIAQLASGRVAAVRIGEAHGEVVVQVADGLSAAEQTEVSSQVRWMLGLDQDFTTFYARAQAEPKLAHVVNTARGRLCRMGRVARSGFLVLGLVLRER
jgi:hypothetical protein